MATLGPQKPRTGYLLPFLLLSLLVHGALLALLSRENISLSVEAEPPPIVVKLAPLPESEVPPAEVRTTAPSKQIVAPSDRENELVPEGEAFLSDRNNRVERETIRRGNPEAGTRGAKPAKEASPEERPAAPAPPAKAEAQPEAIEEPAAKAPPEPAPRPREPAPPARSLPGLDRLLAPPSQVLARAKKAQPAVPLPENATQTNPRRDLMAAPPPVPGILSGLRGNFDHLPNVAPGSLTLLNTKADRFAPFVRRVGTRVFQNMLIYQRNDLDPADIVIANHHVTVRAFLDASGKLTSVDIVERSGSPAVDRTLLQAVRQAAFDPNPPAGAANEDGQFEFIFQAQILARMQPGMRTQKIHSLEALLRVGLM